MIQKTKELPICDTLHKRKMDAYILGNNHPSEFLEKIYLHIINNSNSFPKKNSDEEVFFGVTGTIKYSSRAMQFGALCDSGGLETIANRVKTAFKKENFSENIAYAQNRAQKVRFGMQNEKDTYVNIISFSAFNPTLPFFNHTVDIRKINK